MQYERKAITWVHLTNTYCYFKRSSDGLPHPSGLLVPSSAIQEASEAVATVMPQNKKRWLHATSLSSFSVGEYVLKYTSVLHRILQVLQAQSVDLPNKRLPKLIPVLSYFLLKITCYRVYTVNREIFVQKYFHAIIFRVKIFFVREQAIRKYFNNENFSTMRNLEYIVIRT